MQVFSESVKQNLSHKAKYNQGFGYTKRAINLALKIGCENKLNSLLQYWIKEKKKEIDDKNKNKSNKKISQISVILIKLK